MFRSRLPVSVDLQPPCRVRQIFGPPVVEGFVFTKILGSTLSALCELILVLVVSL